MKRDYETVEANPFRRQWQAIREAALDAVERVGSSGWYILGREVDAFEGAFAKHVGIRHAVGCASGLDAIEIALRVAGLRTGDRVLTTPLSAFATTLAIVRAGGVPVFVDVDEAGLLDLERAAACLGKHPSIRFMVPVHLFGHPLDLARLAALRDRFDVRVIEDAAQAVTARSGDLPVGSVGHATIFSFYPTKNLGALGDAGCIVTNEPSFADAARCLRDYGQSSKYLHEHLGMNSRLDELHAAILRSAMLPHLDAWTVRRQEIAAIYSARLANERVACVPLPARSKSAWHLFPVLVGDKRRDQLMRELSARGIQSAVHYPRPIPLQPAMAGAKYEVFGDFPNAERYANQELSLPISPHLRDDEIARVVDAINGWRP